MRIRIVQFRLVGLDDDDYAAQALSAAPAFAAWPGLRGKVWLADPATSTYGGVYLFESAEDADASRTTGLFQGMAASPHFADLTIREFDVLDAPTAVTAAGVLSES